jgi:hypothetical protein
VRVGGGLNFVTGPMGAGKTLYAVRRIVEAVSTGQYVVTNVELREGWEDVVARRMSRLNRGRRRDLVTRLGQRYVYEDDLQAAMRYRLAGDGEARGVFVWDEGHNDLNNRSWRDDGRADVLRWATQLRKLGFVGYLLSQHADNTDAALRRVCNFHVKLQNQREQTRAFGMRITPVALFLAYWYPAHLGLSGQKIPPTKVERYFLDWHRHLYDTFGLYHGLAGDHEAGTILLGQPAPVLVPEGQADGPATTQQRPTPDANSTPVTTRAAKPGGPRSSKEVTLHAAETTSRA